jgi:hypothetical protein
VLHTKQDRPILPGNRETDFLEEYRPNVHFAKVQLKHNDRLVGGFSPMSFPRKRESSYAAAFLDPLPAQG